MIYLKITEWAGFVTTVLPLILICWKNENGGSKFLWIFNFFQFKKFDNLRIRRKNSMTTIKPKLYERNLTNMAMFLIAVFVFCNSFICVYFILRGTKILAWDHPASDYLYPTACVLTVVNSSVNVIIYGFFNTEFRQALLFLFCPYVSPEQDTEEYTPWMF